MARHHTDEQKSAILAKYESLIDKGVKAPQAAKKAGVAYLTIRRWTNAGIKPKAARAKAAPVAQGGARIVLILPNGFRIEAEDPEDIVTVLKSL